MTNFGCEKTNAQMLTCAVKAN